MDGLGRCDQAGCGQGRAERGRLGHLTRNRKLPHPVYLGLREDTNRNEVMRALRLRHYPRRPEEPWFAIRRQMSLKATFVFAQSALECGASPHRFHKMVESRFCKSAGKSSAWI